MKVITIGGVPAAGKTYTSKLLAKQYNFLALEFEALRWDFYNENLEKNLYKYTKNAPFLENETMRDYYLRCTLYESIIPLETLIKWQKVTIDYIGSKIDRILDEYILIKTEEDYELFCNKYKILINYKPKYTNLDKSVIVCSHAFINTIEFTKKTRIKIDFTSDKSIIINRFKNREKIEDSLDNKLKLYYKSYEDILTCSKAILLDTTKIDVTDKILKLL